MVDTDKRKAYLRPYYQEHKADYARRGKEWDSTHRQARVGHTLKHRAKNLERYKEYQKSYGPEYRINHSEKWKAYNRNYGKLHYQRNKFKYFLKAQKRRADLAKATVNLKSIEEFVERVKSQKHCFCYYCKRRVDPSEIHFDHIIAISRGGQHSVENLCVACPGCNLSKGAKTISEWKRIGQQILEV